MPASKHRRKGETRPRHNLKTLLGTTDPRKDPEAVKEDALIQARLYELHGERAWTDAEYGEVSAQLVAEGKIRPSSL
jgi:hypothetical protein